MAVDLQIRQTIEYRTAARYGDRSVTVARELMLGESLSVASAVGKLAVGVPLCLVGPMFVTLIVGWADHRIGGGGLGFWPTLLLHSLVLVPVLMWLERRTRGRFFEDAVQGESSPSSMGSYGGYELQSTKFLWTAYTEVALVGPRLVWGVIDWGRGRPPVDPAVRLAAADLVVELFDAAAGQQVRDLVRPDRPLAVLSSAIKYLRWRGWVDVAKRRDRVWLLSETRLRLAPKLRETGTTPSET